MTPGATTAYLSAPLFSEAERAFNRRVERTLHSLGLRTYRPQRDNRDTDPAQIFANDCAAIRTSELFVFILDGCVPDEGTCVELGMAYTLRKSCFGLQTDRRRTGTDRHRNNIMIDYALTGGLAHTLKDLATALRAHLSRGQGGKNVERYSAGRPVNLRSPHACRDVE